MSNTETPSFTPSEIELANRLDGIFQRVQTLVEDVDSGEITQTQLVKRLERIEMLVSRVIAPYRELI